MAISVADCIVEPVIDSPNNTEDEESASESVQASPLFIVGVLSFIAVVACFVVYDISEDYRRQMEAHNSYQPVQAVVYHSEIKARRNRQSGRNSYHPDIDYRYNVGGRDYEGRRYSYSYKFNNSRAVIEDIVARHPTGANVTAFYDPDNPKRSVLNNDPPNIIWLVLFFTGFGLIFLTIAGIVIKDLMAKRRDKMRR